MRPRRPVPHRLKPTLVVVTAAAAVVTLGVGVAGVSRAQASSEGRVTGFGGKCVDVADAATVNGTQVQLYRCNGTAAQRWTIGDDGTLRALGKCLDVAGGSRADGAKVQLYDCNGTGAQRWTATSGRLVNPQSGKCLDAKDVRSDDRTPLQTWACTGADNQRWSLPGGVPSATSTAASSTSPAATATPSPTRTATPSPTRTATGTPTPSTTSAPSTPDLGPNVVVLDPSMSASTVQGKLNTVFAKQERNQFGPERYALLFKPGSYAADVNVGFYTQVAGLGLSPDDVTINGAVHAEADWFDGNATQNFWRSAENLSVRPTSGADRWAVSQASPYRRMHVRGDLQLDDGGWSSGGFIADSVIDGQVRSGSQQQWLTRNSRLGSWNGSNWNMVFVGVQNAPANSFPNPPYTTVARTPVVREKPFLYVDGAGGYRVFVPALRSDSQGVTWGNGTPAGTSLPIGDFYVAKPGVAASTLNQALAQGKNLLFTPGVYHLTEPVQVTRPDTVVLGLGLATLMPDRGTAAMTVADVDGVKIAGLLFDAGTTNSPVLLEVGPSGASKGHAADPTSLHDVFLRVGGAVTGKASVSLRVNSRNVIGDHLWIWRADHSDADTVGWSKNTAANGLVVGGDDVTMYGLFVEHYQQYQTVWNGNGGRTYFYQNEMPYDPPNQASWRSGARGYAAYKVADSVTSHEAWGVGSYCYFSTDPSIVADRAVEAPKASGVRFHDVVTVSLGGKGTISHAVNDAGAAADSGHTVSDLVSYP